MLGLTPVTVLLGGVEHYVKEVLNLSSLIYSNLMGYSTYIPPADDKLLSRGVSTKNALCPGYQMTSNLVAMLFLFLWIFHYSPIILLSFRGSYKKVQPVQRV